ncbi:ubiquitin carboxyl-terminal hydrolase 23 isoform X2 [Vigna angularis]|uniref:ubiquitin carboxyl-terminal hydrolase 23 isoform X2 n=1 Tax=Phaseolus angularis TaxID=3914 RepID=UPI0022B4F31F|nr:ubiquitin carboxyl-terminal hydrolase 23 isoform X2 [Vigna angularis]
MVEVSLMEIQPPNQMDPSTSGITPLPRKIVFIPVKKPFKGFSHDFHIETLNPSSSSEPGISGSTSKKHDVTEFSEVGLDPELSIGITFRRIGAGLRNLGNTCFLNSVLQCLTYTEPLAAYLQSGKHKTSCHVAGFCALCAIQNHVSRALQSTGRILSPEDLVGNLRCISRNFRNARQEDAHEYMVNLLECMHKCCLPSGVPSESPSAYEKSFVHKIFGGRLRSQDGDVKYSLYGVLVHTGSSTHSGHYYCYVRTSNNMWYTLDDNRVSHVSEREVLNQQAYMLFYVRDRESIVPRKPVDIAKKENVKSNVNGNKESSTSSHVLMEYPNVPAENKFCNEVEKKMSNVDSLGASSMNDSHVLQNRSVILVENLMQSKKHESEPPSKAQTQDSPDGLAVAKAGHGCLSSLGQSEKDYSLHSNQKSLSALVGEKINLCNENVISKEGITDSPSLVPSSTNPQTYELASDGKSQSMKLGTSTTGLVSEQASRMVNGDRVVSQGLVLNESVNRSLNSEGLDKKPVKKLKRKFLKYQVSRMHFRPIFLYMGYLGPRKKSHKRSKCLTLSKKSPKKDKLDKFAFSSYDSKPSTHRKTDEFPCMSSCSESKATKAGCRPGVNVKSNDESLTENSAEGEFKKRIDQNCTVLASVSQLGSGSVVSELKARQAANVQDSRRDQMHNGLMSMLTRGLEETVVARWDDIELPSSQPLGSKNDTFVSIGYVGDEWDEEYDKGKRKKIRGLKHSFGGPNLFQEIAIEKSKCKRAKLDQPCSGNPPFRI